MAGGISKLCWPECLHVLGYARVGVVEPGLCAPLNPENSRHRDVHGGGRAASYMCLLSEGLSRVRAEAACSSLQRAGIPPSPSGSHKYLPACDWKICIKTLSVGLMCSTGLFLAAGASPSGTLGNMHTYAHAHMCKQAGSGEETGLDTGEVKEKEGQRGGAKSRQN